MKNTSILFILTLITLAACNKSEPFQQNMTNTPRVSLLGFEDFEIGDEIKYQLFLGGNLLDDDNPDYEVRKDTLILEVCGVQDGRYVISEKLSASSEIFSNGENYYHYEDSIFTNYWYAINDTIYMQPKGNNTYASHLFVGIPKALGLNEFSENETELFSWKISEPGGNYQGEFFVKDGIINDNLYPHINVYGNLYAMAADGPGFLYFYNREDGFLRTATISGWTGKAVGWERIKD